MRPPKHMPAYYPKIWDYTYFISSLPALTFGINPPFSFDAFLTQANSFILETDACILKDISSTGEYISKDYYPAALKKWYGFNTALRNELVKVRAAHKRIDPLIYVRPQSQEADASLTAIAMSVHRNPSLLEAERFLDQQRWSFLESLIFGHYFDIDFLVVYGLKLLILARWERIHKADTRELLIAALAGA